MCRRLWRTRKVPPVNGDVAHVVGGGVGLIVAGGEAPNAAWLRAEASAAAVVVAADRGAVALVNAGLLPDALVGDLDSADQETVDWLRANGVEIVTYPSDKDATDLALAIEYAITRGVQRLRITGALRQSPRETSRIDHLFGNFAALAGAATRVHEARLVEADSEVVILTGPGECDVSGSVGDHVSLVPLTASVDGTTTSGLRWALDNDSLAWGTTRGVSNEMASTQARVRVSAGRLLVAMQRHM